MMFWMEFDLRRLWLGTLHQFSDFKKQQKRNGQKTDYFISQLHLYRIHLLMISLHVLRALLLMSCIATITLQTILDIKFQSFNTEYKWYINLFPASKNQPAQSRMAMLFETEKEKMAELDKAEILLKSKKQSVSQTGYLFITLYIFIRIWQIPLYFVS